MLEKSEHTDAVFVKQLKAGDMQAFNKLFEEYGRRLYGFGIKYLKSEEDTEEMVQEIFLKIWRNRERLDVARSFKAYLFTIAFNEIKKFFHKKAVLFELADNYVSSLADHSTEETIDYNLALEHIAGLLDQLPPRRRQIFEMSRFENMPSKEIARHLGISAKTVDNQVSEVIHYLKNNMLGNLGCLLLIMLFFDFM